MNTQRPSFGILLAAATCALLAGCANVNPDGFREFSKSTADFQAGADGAFAGVQNLARAEFVEPSPFGDDPTFDQLLLVWDPADSTIATAEARPLYAMIREERRGAAALNAAVADYANYLALLAGGSEDDAKRVEALAGAANGNLRSARDSLGADISDDQLAIASTLGAEILRQKIESDRREFLREAMDAAQPTIDRFADHMAQAMSLLALDVSSVYSAKAEGMRREHSARDAKGKRQIELALLAYNDETQILLDTLRTLRESYRTIPAAHAELRKQLDDKEEFVTAVMRLRSDAQRLERLEEELAKETPD